ncbi:hypothetical protein BDN72DRAFT_864224 [Pluteus cervinus]|uniref:Uncharacterized protein n=1 Tax=Pluteus cervinus TaxID=181527 RepID=A0ACD3A5D0_9AGAR|nr:hypothetical protein BDN72DRAFT_864224 [Pluteus cervinus]
MTTISPSTTPVPSPPPALTLPAKVVYPAPPPTTNSLTGAQRSQLLKSTKKLGKILGATPYLVDEGPVMVHLPFGERDSPLLRRSVESCSSSGSLSSNEDVSITARSTLERALSLKSTASSSSAGSYGTTHSAARSISKFSTISTHSVTRSESSGYLATQDAFDTQSSSKFKAKPPMLRLGPPQSKSMHSTLPDAKSVNSFPVSRRSAYSEMTLTSSRRRSRASAKSYFTTTDESQKDLPGLPDELGQEIGIRNDVNVLTTMITPASPTSPTSSTSGSSIDDTETGTTDELDLLPTHTPFTLRPKSANTAMAGREASLSPPSFMIPTTTALRRQKMERLQRKLGESSIPFDLVFPELAREGDDGKSTVAGSSIATQTSAKGPISSPPSIQSISSTPSTPLSVAILRPAPPPNHGKIAHARDSLADGTPHKAKRRSTSPRARSPSVDGGKAGGQGCGNISPRKGSFEIDVSIKASRPAPPPPAGGSSRSSRKQEGKGDKGKASGRHAKDKPTAPTTSRGQKSTLTISMAGVSSGNVQVGSSSQSNNSIVTATASPDTTATSKASPTAKSSGTAERDTTDPKRIGRTSSLEVILEFPDHEGEVQAGGFGGYRQRVYAGKGDSKGALTRSTSTSMSTPGPARRWFSQLGRRRFQLGSPGSSSAAPSNLKPGSVIEHDVDGDAKGELEVNVSTSTQTFSDSGSFDSSMAMMVNPKRRSWTTRKPPPALIPELSLGSGSNLESDEDPSMGSSFAVPLPA